jgi:thiamine-monophosphate kinase
VATAWAGRQGTGTEGALQLAIHGGEDYELLFAVPTRSRRHFETVAGRHTPVRCIGELVAGVDTLLVWDDAGGRTTALGGGFTHF